MSNDANTAVAVRESTAVATTQEYQVPGLDAFNASDAIMPRLRLVQAQSGFSEDAGTLHNNITGVAKSKLTVAVIGARKGRVKWPAGEFRREQEPQCASDDAVMAREGMAGVMHDGTPTEECEKCIYSQWSTGDDDRRLPPACSLSYNFLVVDVDDDLPALLAFQRTSARAGRTLVTLVKAFGFRRTYEIGTEQQKSELGKYYVLTVKAGDAVVPDRLNHYVKLAEMYAEQSIITTDTEGETRAQPNGVRRDEGTSFNPKDLERE